MNSVAITYGKILDDHSIRYEILEHPSSPVIAEVIDSLGITLAESMPTLICKADDSFIAVIMRGDCRADFKRIKKEFGYKDLRLATPEEFTELTGLPVGAARPCNPGLKTIIDPLVFEQEELVGGSGCFDCSIRYQTNDLNSIPDSTVFSVVREQEEAWQNA